MDQNKLSLLSELPGLQSAKSAIDARILFIQQQLQNDGPGQGYIVNPALLPVPDDPDILGRDSLGRIKRKRTISPEVRAQKQRLIAAARQKRLDQLQKANQPPEETPRPVAASQVVPAPAPNGAPAKSPRKRHSG